MSTVDHPVKKILNYENGSFLVLWGDDTKSWVEEKDMCRNYSVAYKDMLQDNSKKVHFRELIEKSKVFVNVYIRTSSDDPSASPAAQEEFIKNYCDKNNFYINRIYFEIGKSARNMDKLFHLNTCAANLDVNSSCGLPKAIVVYDVSRFTRNVLQGLEFIKELNDIKIDVMFAYENLHSNVVSDRHLISTHMANAQLLSDTVSQKVKAAKEILRKQGKFTGGVVPYGAVVIDKILYRKPDMFPVIEKLYKYFLKTDKQKILSFIRDNSMILLGKDIVELGDYSKLKSRVLHNYSRLKKLPDAVDIVAGLRSMSVDGDDASSESSESSGDGSDGSDDHDQESLAAAQWLEQSLQSIDKEENGEYNEDIDDDEDVRSHSDTHESELLSNQIDMFLQTLKEQQKQLSLMQKKLNKLQRK